jgi:seryl-tRNA synthetase
MLDVNVIREDPELIRIMLRNRNYPEGALDLFIQVDGEWRKLVDDSNQLKRLRNTVADQIPRLRAEEKKAKIDEMKHVAQRITEIDAKIDQ